MQQRKKLQGEFSILRIATRIFPDIGGPANHVHEISTSLEILGWKNSCVACKNSDGAYPPRKRKYRIVSLPFPSVARSKRIQRIMFFFAFLIFGTFLTLLECLRRKPTIIHSHSPFLTAIVGTIISRVFRRPLVYTVHGLNRWSRAAKFRTTGFQLDEMILKKASGIVAISREYSEYIAKAEPGRTVLAVGNGIDVNKFRPSEDSLEKDALSEELGLDKGKAFFLYVGNMYLPEKVEGLRDLICAIDQVRNQFETHAHLLLVGDGESRQDLEELTKEIGLAGSVRFLGQRRDVPRLLRASDVFILPSRHEGSPNALLEAMASGLTCIGSNVGGIPDIVGGAGILTRVGDIKSLSSAIMRVILDQKLRKQLGVQARERAVNELSWERAAKRLIKFYHEVLSHEDS